MILRRAARPIAALALAFAASAASADALFPARTGESGLLDVPDAEVVPRENGLLGAEFRFDRPQGVRSSAGPFPLYVVAGFLKGMELGFTMREWGQPGDPAPSPLLFGGAFKLQLVPPIVGVGIAVDASVDRLNSDRVWGSRLVVSTPSRLPLRLAAYAGGELGTDSGVTYGGALSLHLGEGPEVVAEAIGGPRGSSFGAAVRYPVRPGVGMSLGVNYLPSDQGLRVSLGIGFGPKPGKRAAPQPQQAPRTVAATPAPEVVGFRDDRPHFRLRMRSPDPLGTDPRPLRHGPWTGTAVASRAATPTAAPTAAAARPVAPSLEDLAEAQLKEQEALADARERRVRATLAALEEREKTVAADAARLDGVERDLGTREQALDARERRITFRGPPTQQLRQLESLEAQLASQERQTSALERSYGPALDAAAGREREAAAREDAERQEATRLAASVGDASSRALRVEVRKQALGARNRQLSALEARLLAMGERLDALERRQRTRGERVGHWSRRLDTRSERLDLLENRADESQKPAQAPAPDASKATGAAAPKDKPVFVMIVKTPAAIMKERAPSAEPAAGGVRAGAAVEKAVTAATIVTFATPQAQLSELDREAVDNIARVAARESCDVLIWARAKDAALTVEAQRRATELRARVVAAGPVAEARVQTRVTTRPSAQGVDVVVSALRETAKAAPAPAPAPAAAAPSLLAGETGKRQIREAVQAAQKSIEDCVGEVIARKNLQRAEGLLKLGVGADGRVASVVPAEGDLAGAQVEECLARASKAWTFPAAGAEYVVDVPITIIRGGAAR